MIFSFFALVSLIFMSPSIEVRWVERAQSTVDLALIDADADTTTDARECVTAGLKLRTRYDVKICRHRVAWFDSCSERRREFRTMQYDPIGEVYKVETDVYGDNTPAEITSEASFDKALSMIGAVPAISLLKLSAEDPEILQSARTFVSVRVLRECQGEYNATLARVSRFITLGLVDIGRFDSGWIDFRLHEQG